jgi:hypothetical protein
MDHFPRSWGNVNGTGAARQLKAYALARLTAKYDSPNQSANQTKERTA